MLEEPDSSKTYMKTEAELNINTDTEQSSGLVKHALNFISRCIHTVFHAKKYSLKESVDELIKEHDETKSMRDEEKTMLKNFVNFSELKASEVMIPRTDIIGVPNTASFRDIKKIVLEEGHTRLPIYKESLDEIIGFIHIKDFFSNIDKPDSFNLKPIIRNIIYAPRSMKVIDLLAKMRLSATHIAVILDEYGGTDGLVTIEDLVEEIIGDIKDEHDLHETTLEVIDLGNNIFNIDGRADIEEVEEKLNISLSEENGEYETFGGFILSYLGLIPSVGEIIHHPSGIIIEITDADERRIKNTKVVLAKEEQAEDN